MPIHQQLWSLECSVVETVASLFRGVTEHCLAWRRSHCPDNVNDIQAMGSLQQINVTVLVIGVTSIKFKQCSIQLPKQFCLGLLHASFPRQKIGDVFMSHSVHCNFFIPPLHSIPLSGGVPVGILWYHLVRKNYNGYTMVKKVWGYV